MVRTKKPDEKTNIVEEQSTSVSELEVDIDNEFFLDIVSI